MGEYRLFAFCPAVFFGPTLSDTFSAQGTRLYDSLLEPQPLPPQIFVLIVLRLFFVESTIGAERAWVIDHRSIYTVIDEALLAYRIDLWLSSGKLGIWERQKAIA